MNEFVKIKIFKIKFVIKLKSVCNMSCINSFWYNLFVSLLFMDFGIFKSVGFMEED